MGAKLLVADDEAFSRKMVVEMVRGAWPHAIVSVANGADAMAELVGPAAGDIRALISDFNMPGVNGLQLLKAIRMGIEGIRRDLPVILLTGHADKGLIATAIALDVDAFLAKPVSRLTLGDKVRRVLDGDERTIKPAKAYASIEVREDMLIHWRVRQDDGKAEDGKAAISGSLDMIPAVPLEKIPEGAILAAPILFPDGTVVVPAGRTLGRALIDRLLDLRAMGYAMEPVRITLV